MSIILFSDSFKNESEQQKLEKTTSAKKAKEISLEPKEADDEITAYLKSELQKIPFCKTVKEYEKIMEDLNLHPLHSIDNSSFEGLTDDLFSNCGGKTSIVYIPGLPNTNPNFYSPRDTEGNSYYRVQVRGRMGCGTCDKDKNGQYITYTYLIFSQEDILKNRAFRNNKIDMESFIKNSVRFNIRECTKKNEYILYGVPVDLSHCLDDDVRNDRLETGGPTKCYYQDIICDTIEDVIKRDNTHLFGKIKEMGFKSIDDLVSKMHKNILGICNEYSGYVIDMHIPSYSSDRFVDVGGYGYFEKDGYKYQLFTFEKIKIANLKYKISVEQFIDRSIIIRDSNEQVYFISVYEDAFTKLEYPDTRKKNTTSGKITILEKEFSVITTMNGFKKAEAELFKRVLGSSHSSMCSVKNLEDFVEDFAKKSNHCSLIDISKGGNIYAEGYSNFTINGKKYSVILFDTKYYINEEGSYSPNNSPLGLNYFYDKILDNCFLFKGRNWKDKEAVLVYALVKGATKGD